MNVNDLFNSKPEQQFKKGITESRQWLSESSVNSPVSSAITRRILNQRTDLLKYGPVAVMAAIDDVADWIGDVEEIGSSDVSAWVAQVERMLKENPPEAFVNEADPLNKFRQRVQSQGFTDSPEERNADRLERKRRHAAALDKISNISGLGSDEEAKHQAQQRMARDEYDTQRRKDDDEDTRKTFNMMRDRLNRMQYKNQRDVDPKQLKKITDIKYVDENNNSYGYEVGQQVKLSNGKQGQVVDIFDDSIEVLLTTGRTITVDFRDAQVLDEQSGSQQMTPNWAKYVLDQIYNSDGEVTMTDLFDEGIPGLHEMFMDTAEEFGLNTDDEFNDVEHEVILKLEDLVKGGRELDEAGAQDTYYPRTPPGHYDDMFDPKNSHIRPGPPTRGVDAKGRTQSQWLALVKKKFPDAKVMVAKMMDGPCVATLADGRKLYWSKVEQGVAETRRMDSYDKDVHASQQGFDRPADHRGLRQELAHERNNLQISINGRPWKVVPGRGYADSQEERSYLRSMQSWAEKKSASTGKKWSVSLTGADVSESQKKSELDEVSTELLGRYKTAAAADAKKSDAAGNYKRGDKRFAGINRATIKQFDNDLKKHGQQGVAEASLGTVLQWPEVVNKVTSAMKAMGWKGKRKDDNSYMFSTKGQLDDEFYMAIIENKGNNMFHYALGTVEEGDPYIGEQETLPMTAASVSELMDSIREGFGLNEGWKSRLAGAALAGAAALGAGGANARVTYDADGNQIGGLKPSATVTAPADTKPAAEAPKGFSKEYLQKAADPNRFGRYLISVERAQELLKQMDSTRPAVNEQSSTSGNEVESAITRRILTQNTDLLMKYGPQKVMQAIEEVAYNIGDLDEIGSSDVSSWVNQVKRILGAQ